MDIREEVFELENADGVKVKFAFVDTVEHEGVYYCALESIENADGIEIGDTVFFKLLEDQEDMELIDDEDLLDILFEKLDEQLAEEDNV